MATPEQDSPIKKRRGPSVLGWIMMGMLIVGLGGFGVTNFGGSTAAIGRVGDRDIEVDTYVRELRQELSAFSAQVGQQIGLAQAQALGLDQKVLQTVIGRTALDAEAERIGISVGDDVVATEVSGMQAFQGISGAFDRETYANVTNGLNGPQKVKKLDPARSSQFKINDDCSVICENFITIRGASSTKKAVRFLFCTAGVYENCSKTL